MIKKIPKLVCKVWVRCASVVAQTHEVLTNADRTTDQAKIRKNDIVKIEAVAMVVDRFIDAKCVVGPQLLLCLGGAALKLSKPGIPTAGKSLRMCLNTK